MREGERKGEREKGRKEIGERGRRREARREGGRKGGRGRRRERNEREEGQGRERKEDREGEKELGERSKCDKQYFTSDTKYSREAELEKGAYSPLLAQSAGAKALHTSGSPFT